MKTFEETKMKLNTNQVTYQIALVPENAEKIDKINRILLGDDYTKEVEEVVEVEVVKQKLTFDDLKKEIREARNKRGVDVVYGLLDALGVKKEISLNKRIGYVDEEHYESLIAKLKEEVKKNEQRD